jgi:hypothetical protein
MISTGRASFSLVSVSRFMGSPARPRLGYFALLACLALGGPGCRLEGDPLLPHPRSDTTSRAATGERKEPARVAGFSLPEGHAATPRGPRHDLLGMSRTQLWAAWNSLRGDAYRLDEVERVIARGTPLGCNPEALVVHRGKLLPYRGSVQVDPAFAERLVRFEQLVIDVAREVYGRAPERLRHVGAYSCRPTRNRSARMSEHALGNAIDVVGFDFGRVRRGEPLPEGLPKALSGPFQVRVERHWSAANASPAAAAHERFLRELAARLSDRADVFRGMIGPSRSDHADHFHFDMSPWRYVYF